MRSDPDPAAAGGGAPRRLHPFALLVAMFNVGRAWIVPALVGGASLGGGQAGRVVFWVLLLLVVPSLVSAIAEYFAFRFRLREDELVVHSGVLRRRQRVMPLARIQNVEMRQSALQRLFDVAEVRVETASGGSDEAVPLVLKHREAITLRDELLAGRAAAGSPSTAEVLVPAPEAGVLARLRPGDLVLAGATANEAGVIAAVLIGAIELAYRLPLGIPRPTVGLREMLPDLSLIGVVLLGTAVVLLFVLVAWLFSIGGALIRYWDFTLERRGNELRKRHGLLDRREVVVPLARVQMLQIEESLLRRPLGLASLKVETAGSSPGESGRRGAEALLPLARAREVPDFVAAIFEDVVYGDLELLSVHSYARRRVFFRYLALVAAAAGALTVFLGPFALWLVILVPFAYLAAHIHYRHLGYRLLPGYVAVRGGFLNRVTWLIPERKIQTLHLIETPFQRRRSLATVVVDTAAGAVRIPDLVRSEALAVLARIGGRSGADPSHGRSVLVTRISEDGVSQR